MFADPLSVSRCSTQPKTSRTWPRSPPLWTLWTSREPSGPSSCPTRQVPIRLSPLFPYYPLPSYLNSNCVHMGITWLLFTFLPFHLQFLYTDLASKERAHFSQEMETPAMGHARTMKVINSYVSISFPCHFFNYVIYWTWLSQSNLFL